MKREFKRRYILYILLILFLIYNFIWAINYTKYNSMKRAMGYHAGHQSYVSEENGFMYTIALPSYLSFKASFSITEKERPGEKQLEDTINMTIWSDASLKEFEVVLDFTIEVVEERDGVMPETYTKVIALYLDEDMKSLNEESEKLLKEYPQCMDTVKMMYQKAYDKWGILGAE